MKKTFVSAAFILATVAAFAQTKTPVKSAPAKKPAAPAQPVKVLKTLSDSASYAIGVSVASFYKQQGLSSLNATMVSKAINDLLTNKKPLLSEFEANNAIMKYMNKAQEAKAKPNIEKGEQFLAANKKKEGVKTTASGLQYQVLTAGTGPKPTINDTVTVNYVGTLVDGTEFDNSYKRGEPISFPVTGVIKGWTEALQLMPVGSKYKLFIPQELAYGTNEMGAIPAGSVLVFEVELLKTGSNQQP